MSSSFQVQGNPIKPDLPPRPDYRTWKWVTLGVGLALGGASAGLLAHSYGMTDDLSALNEQAAAGQLDEAEYGTRFDDTRATQVATWRAGVASAAVGGAALVAGVVLFILDAQAEPVVEADADGLRAGMRLRF